jgi:aerobic-type carbon monoxide dehydrogenase small subunit (CoxS/CutS family)
MSTGLGHLIDLVERLHTLRFQVNDRDVCIEIRGDTVLVDLLRDGLGLKGTHIGCWTGDCGACTVAVDGLAVRSCTILAATMEGAEINTIESLGTPDRLHPVQEAFWDEYGFQCGFCLPGMLFSALDLIERAPDPSETEVRDALSGTLCRCTGYQPQVAAVQAAARRMSFANR